MVEGPPVDAPVERECPSCRGTGEPGKTLVEIFAREELLACTRPKV